MYGAEEARAVVEEARLEDLVALVVAGGHAVERVALITSFECGWECGWGVWLGSVVGNAFVEKDW